MVSGLSLSNYDITHMFIDSLCRVVPATAAPRSRSSWTGWMPSPRKNNIKFTVTISADAELAHEGVRGFENRYICKAVVIDHGFVFLIFSLLTLCGASC